MNFAAHPSLRYPQYRRSSSSAKPVLVAALFVLLAGNIPPFGGFSMDSDSSSAIVRAAGLLTASVLLSVNLAQQGSDGIRRVMFFLSPFFAFLAFCMISAGWSLDPKATIIRSSESAVTIVFCALWTHAAVRASSSEKEICAWIALAIAGIAVYGLLINTLLFGHPIRMVMSNEFSGRLRLVFGGLHPLAIGDIMAIGIIAAVMSSFSALRKLAALLLFVPLLILTDATGARILTAVLIGIYFFVQAVKRLGVLRVIVLSVLFGIVAGLAAAIAFSVESPFSDVGHASGRVMTLTGRTELWSVIWESGLANTWFGAGFDAARGAIGDVFGVAYQAHNQYLSILVELGYVGAFVFIPVFVLWLVPVVQSRSIVAWSFTFYVIGINMNNASMFTKTWLIFATVFCYILSIEQKIMRVHPRRMAPVRRRSFPASRALAQQ